MSDFIRVGKTFVNLAHVMRVEVHRFTRYYDETGRLLDPDFDEVGVPGVTSRPVTRAGVLFAGQQEPEWFENEQAERLLRALEELTFDFA